MDMSNAAQAQTAQIGHVQGYVGIDVAVRIGSFVAKFFSVRCISFSYVIRNDDDNAIKLDKTPSL